MPPIQILQGVPTAAVQMPSYTAPPGSMILVQGPHGMALAQDVSSTFVTQGGQPCQLLPATPMEILPSEGSQKVSVIMDMGGSTAYVSQGEVQGYITQLDGPPRTTKKSRKYKNSKKLGEKFETARKEEQAKLGVVMEEEREEEERMQVDEGVSPNTQEQLLSESDHKEQLSSGNLPTAGLQDNKTEHATTTFQTTETESPMLISRSAAALASVPDVSTLDIDTTAWAKEMGMRSGDSGAISRVPDNLTLFPVGMPSGSGAGVGIGGLRKCVSAEDLMTEQLKSYLEKEKRARKAKCLSPPQEDGTAQALSTPTIPTTPEVSAHILQRKKTLQRQRASSTTSTSSRSGSTSPTRGKSPKSSRLVVSPTLFSASVVGGNQFVGALRCATSTATVCKNKSTKLPTSSSPVSISDRDSRLQNSHVDPSISLEPGISLHHGNSRTPTKGKEKAGSNPRGELRPTRQIIKAGKSKEHRISSLDLSDLFLPDNLSPASVSNKSCELKKIPETCVAHSSVTKLVEFSSSLPHTSTSSLKRPIPIKTEASGTALGSIDKGEYTLGTSVTPESHREQVTESRQQEEWLPDFSTVSSNQVTLKIGDRKQFEGGSFSENTNNCNSNESSDSSKSNPNSSQKQANEDKEAESEGEESCHEQQEQEQQQQQQQQQQEQQQQQQQLQEQQQQLQEQQQEHQQQQQDSRETTQQQLDKPTTSHSPTLGKREKAEDSNDDPPPPPKRRRGRPRKSDSSKSMASSSQQEGNNEPHASTTQGVNLSRVKGPMQMEVSPPPRTDSPGNPPCPKRKRGRPPKKNIPKKRGRPRKTAPAPDRQETDCAGSGDLKPEDPHSHSSSPSLIEAPTENTRSEKATLQNVCVSTRPSEDVHICDNPEDSMPRRKRKRGGELPDNWEQKSAATDSTVAISTEPVDASMTSTTESESNPSPQKRKRGRPRKSAIKATDVPMATAVSDNPDFKPSPLIKKRGRPPRGAANVLQCEKCSNTYTTKPGLRAHLLAAHPPDLGVSINRLKTLKDTPP